MQSITFFGEVQGGRILTGKPLTEFEGKQVYVTLIAPDVQSGTVAAETERASSLVVPRDPEGAELLQDAGRVRVAAREVVNVSLDFVDVQRPPMRVYSSDMED